MGWQNAQTKGLHRALGLENTLLDSKKREKETMKSLELEKDKKEKITILKMLKIFLDYKKI